MNWYVHYDIRIDATSAPRHVVNGPYSENEVVDQRQRTARSVNVTNCYVSPLLEG